MSRARRKRPKVSKTTPRKTPRWLPAVFVGIYLIGAILLFDPILSNVGDNAQFLILGQSIAAGKGMSQINEPIPSAHTKYPFLFPLLLGGLLKILPYSFTAAKVFVVLLGAASIYALSLLLLRVAPPVLAIPTLLLTTVNPEVLLYSHTVLSEIPYLCVSALSILFFVRWEKEDRPALLIGAFLLAVASYYTRTIGVSLVMAIILASCLKRDFRRAAVLIAAFIVLALPWAVRNTVVGKGDRYAQQLLRVNPYEPELGNLSIRQIFSVRLKENLRKYATTEVGDGVVPVPKYPPSPRGGLGRMALSLAASALFLTGLTLEARRRLGIIEIYTILYLGTCLLWPEVWASLRFLLPLLPFMFLYLLRAVAWLAIMARPGLGKFAPGLLALLLLIPAVHSNARTVSQPKGYPANWANYYRAALWVRESTPESVIVACRKPYLFFLHSQRRSVSYLWSYDKDKVFEKLLADGVDYVVLSQLSATTVKYLLPSVNKYQDRFETVLHLPEPDTYLLRLKEEPNP